MDSKDNPSAPNSDIFNAIYGPAFQKMWKTHHNMASSSSYREILQLYVFLLIGTENIVS
jgi:hypothetical protein